MSPKAKATELVSYMSDPKAFPYTDHAMLELPDALTRAVMNHRPGEMPTIIGNHGLQLIGIEAIKAFRDHSQGVDAEDPADSAGSEGKARPIARGIIPKAR